MNTLLRGGFIKPRPLGVVGDSMYVVGFYRIHTLTAIDVKTDHSFLIVSVLAPANHHDSHFLPFLVNLAQAMGIDIKLVTADTSPPPGTLIEGTFIVSNSKKDKNYYCLF